MIVRRTVGGFWDGAFDDPHCVRCQKGIQQHQIFSSDKGDDSVGGYATIGQIFKRDRIEGGLLCKPCVMSFKKWIKKGEDHE
tara:strand:- start:3301 stop:3546 length:246 start_codon:yes stop_codon:yes gene_type:complete